MKKIVILTTAVCLALVAGIIQVKAQAFAGFRAGKNSGVNGVFSNPASMAGSNYKWDVNLGSAHLEWGFEGSSASDTLFNKNFKGVKTSEMITESLKANGYVNLDLYGPSIMMNLHNSSSLALTTRYRIMGNLHDFGGRVSGSEKDSLFTYTGEASQKAVANAWSEVGASFATIVSKTADHTISAGVTAKYLRGDLNAYGSLSNFSGTAFTGQDAYLTNTYGRFTAGTNQGENEENDVIGHGMGADIGFVFEKAAPLSQQHLKKYKYRLGVSIRDIGAIHYSIRNDQHLDYNVHIPGSDRFHVNVLDSMSCTQVKDYMNSKPNWFTNNQPGGNNYKASLPTTALVSFDMALGAGFYVDMASQISLSNRDDAYSSFLPNYISVTPRYEGKVLSVYLPVGYNEISKMSAGLSVKLGPVFIGSNSLFNNAFGGDISDFHLGLRLGLKHK
jgi:hypothetical protein